MGEIMFRQWRIRNFLIKIKQEECKIGIIRAGRYTEYNMTQYIRAKTKLIKLKMKLNYLLNDKKCHN